MRKHFITGREPSANDRVKKNSQMSKIIITIESENERKRKDRYILRPRQRTKKEWNMRTMMIAIVVGALGTIPKGLEKTVGTGNQSKNRDHPNYNICTIGPTFSAVKKEVRRKRNTQTRR